jgi:hypothetical protein
MEFGPWNFDQMKEADVREDVIMPILQTLGYKKGTDNYIYREAFLSLRYAREYFGRKDTARDPQRPLSGFVDYICDIDKSIGWVIEAKAPDELVDPSVDPDAIEQAYTYSKHPEVRAVLFVVCNGRELRIFQTDLHPAKAELLRVTADEIATRWVEISNLLSPEQMKRRWPRIEIDTGRPLGMGLGSTARVTGGHIHYLTNSRRIPQLADVIISITEGTIGAMTETGWSQH